MLDSIVMVGRHLAAILALPCTVAVFIPVWIARRYGVTFTAPYGPIAVLAMVAGVALAVAGLTLFLASLFFWSRGRGTLAPWVSTAALRC